MVYAIGNINMIVLINIVMKLYEITSIFNKFYHGTSSIFSDDIKKHGVIPNPSQRVHDEGDRWDSLTGSYWTNSKEKAERMAVNATYKFGGRPMIVVAELNLNDALLDEDKFEQEIYAIIKKIIINQNLISDEYKEGLSNPNEAFDEVDNPLELTNFWSFDKITRQKFVKVVADTFHNLIGSTKPIPYNLFDEFLEQSPGPDGVMFDQWSSIKDKIIKYYGNEAAKHATLGYQSHDVRIEGVVGFNTQNRIIDFIVL